MDKEINSDYFRDFRKDCKTLCMVCGLVQCPKIKIQRSDISEIELESLVNKEALPFMEELSLRHPTALFMYTAVDPYANNLPEVCTVFNVNEDEAAWIEEEYDDGIGTYVTDFGLEYDGMTMVMPDVFDLKWLTSDSLIFFVENGRFSIRTK